MELLEFLKTLRRHKLLLILVPALTVLAAYFFVKRMPDKYISRTRIATGILDQSQQLLAANPYHHESKAQQEFGNITEMIMLSKIIDQVSYQLLLHDIKEENTFRHATDLKQLDEKTKAQLISYLEAKRARNEELNLADDQDKQVYNWLVYKGYDHESLRNQLKAYRLNNSDFLELEYESENPALSAFVLNTLANEFVQYYTNVVTENKRKAVVYLDSLLKIKQSNLLTAMEAVKNYKISNGVLDMEEQAKNYYSRMADVATRKGMAEKDYAAYSAALSDINSRFSPGSRKYMESAVSSTNQEIVQTQEEIKALNDAYIKSDFDPKYKARIDSLQSKLTAHIYDQTDRYATNPLAAKENLVTQKLNLEVSRDLARNSAASLDRELNQLNSGLQQMVPGLANIQTLETNVEVANKEYQDILQKFNQATLEASYTLPLRQAEKALPGKAEPSKKMLLVAFSGITSLVFCLVVLFIMFYFDKTIKSPGQLQSATNLPVIGSLNSIDGTVHDVQYLWGQMPLNPGRQYYKNSLRNIRYELEKDLGTSKVIAITSLKSGAGKTFLTTSLAYAFSKINKKVLIIDGNFLHPDISNTIKNPKYLESFLNNAGDHKSENRSISIMGNKGGDCSLLELSSQDAIETIFEELKEHYDIILIETGALESINKVKAKEWIMFAEKVIAVFAAGSDINENMNPEVKYLAELDGKFAGFVVNKMDNDENSRQVMSLRSKAQAYGIRIVQGFSTIRGKLKPST